MATTPTLQQQMREHESVTQLLDTLARVQRRTKVQALLREASFLHQQRPARSMHSRTVTITAMLTAFTEEVKARSRLVELMTDLTRQRDIIRATTEKTQEFLLHKFRARLRDVHSTEAARKRAVAQVLADATDFVDDMDSAIVVLTAYITDVDKAGYALRGLTDLLKIQLSPGGSIVQ